ncbi:MAG TPA: putative lipid II flippase FtsW [Candidatus Paceibacterota bacterium]
MSKKKLPDFILLGLCVSLVLVGIFILASVSSSFSLQRTGNTFFFLNHQLLLGVLPGLLAGTIAFFLPLSFFKKYSFLFLLATIVLLAMVFMPGIGGEFGGASRWIFLGPFSFQPSEILKLAFILYAASWLASRHAKSKKAPNSTLLPFAAIVGIVSLFLILQPDVGTLGVIAATGLVMYFLAGTPIWHTAAMIGMGLLALGGLIAIVPYRLNRFLVFLNSDLDPLGRGYQAKQALIGIGSGGLFGTGLGLSFQKFGSLPEPISDSIFAVFAEELGFVGAVVLLSLFLAFAWRSFVIAKRVPDPFAKLVVWGIAFWIFLQATVNIGSMLGLLPLTGIPLPFISYGGSALMTELLACGILLNISKEAKMP